MNKLCINKDALKKLMTIISILSKKNTKMQKYSVNEIKRLINENNELKSLLDEAFCEYSSTKVIDQEDLRIISGNSTIKNYIKAYIELEEYEIFSELAMKKALEEVKKERNEEYEYNEDYYNLDILTLYKKDLEKYPVLSAEEEKKLFIRYNNGDLEAKEILICSNLRLVISIANVYATNEMPLLDCIQNGNYGLMDAIDRFDVSKGYKFSTYATWWIKQKIIREKQKTADTIRIPVHTGNDLRKILKVIEELACSLHRKPTKEEIFKKSKMTKYDFEKAYKLIDSKPISLNTMVGENEDAELQEFQCDPKVNVEKEAINEVLKNDIIKLTNLLTYREKILVYYRFGIDYILSDIEKDVLNLHNKVMIYKKKNKLKGLYYNDNYFARYPVKEIEKNYHEDKSNSIAIRKAKWYLNIECDVSEEELMILGVYNSVYKEDMIDFSEYEQIKHIKTDKQVLKKHNKYGYLTLEETSEEMNITHERVRQLQLSLCRKLERNGKKLHISDYLYD